MSHALIGHANIKLKDHIRWVLWKQVLQSILKSRQSELSVAQRTRASIDRQCFSTYEYLSLGIVSGVLTVLCLQWMCSIGQACTHLLGWSTGGGFGPLALLIYQAQGGRVAAPIGASDSSDSHSFAGGLTIKLLYTLLICLDSLIQSLLQIKQYN